MRRNENSLLSLFKMEKSQLMAYVSLVQEQHRQGTVEDLLELMGEEGRRKLYESVAAYIRQEQASKDTLAQVFPELTASEKEICRLVLQGDKLKDICEKLNKSKGNITSQRVHIRSKLGLGPKDNLAEALRRRNAAARVYVGKTGLYILCRCLAMINGHAFGRAAKFP